MKKKLHELKIDTFTGLLTKHLSSRGIQYNPNKTVYDFVVGTNECRLTINGPTMKIENITTQKVDYYDFGTYVNDTIMIHSRFINSDYVAVNLSHSEVHLDDGKIKMISSAAQIETPLVEAKCADKLLFFCDRLVGDTIFDTIENINNFDGSITTALLCDVPKTISSSNIVSTVVRNESNLINEINHTKTR